MTCSLPGMARALSVTYPLIRSMASRLRVRRWAEVTLAAAGMTAVVLDR
jgi:hypothetical protein